LVREFFIGRADVIWDLGRWISGRVKGKKNGRVV